MINIVIYIDTCAWRKKNDVTHYTESFGKHMIEKQKKNISLPQAKSNVAINVSL